MRLLTSSIQDCGCPEEEWLIGNLEVIIHLEPDGSGHAFIDCGEWEADRHFSGVSDMEDLRRAAQAWVEALPAEGS